MKTPISLIIDDGAPLVQVYHAHITPPVTRDVIRALAEVAKRIREHLSDRVEWTSFDRQAEIAVADNVKRPAF